MTEQRRALGAIIVCVLFWGLSFVSIKEAVAVFPPMTLGALRFALAVVFLLAVKRRIGPAREDLKAQDLPWLLGSGLTGVTFYFFCENNGVALVSASEASVIVAAIPVLTMAAEWIGARLFPSMAGERGALQEPAGMAALRWIGALVSAAGVWMVAGVSFAVSGSLRGYIFMAGAALSWVVYCFLTRPLFRRCSRIYITFWQNVAGFIGFLPFAALEYPRWGQPDLPVILHIVFLGICCSALGYWFYIRALETLGVSVSAVFINFIPVVTVIAGFFFLGDRLHPLQWAGAALVLAGVYLAMRPGERNKTGPGT